MTTKPERRKGEGLSAYFLRVVEWEKIHKAECLAFGRSIDSALKIPRVASDKAVTKQTELERRSIHDIAQNDPCLCAILRRIQ